jgi:nitrate/nitrite-specific signal transduction histidine kinase
VPDQSNPVGHFGMLDMRERAESLDTRLQVQSEPGRGTQITVEVNTQNQPKADVEPKTHTYSGGG